MGKSLIITNPQNHRIMGALEYPNGMSNREEFELVFEKLVEDVVRERVLPDHVAEWYRKSLYHNTIGGKYNRGISIIDTVATLVERPLSSEEIFTTSALGWMVELFQAFMLVSDDIMDGSKLRRGKRCWYREDGVGMIAINDAVMLESAIYILLKKYLRDHPAYIDMVELFHTVTYQTEVGQTCDLIGAASNVDIETFSMEQYLTTVTYKTAYYTFHLPICLALMYVGKATPLNIAAVERVSLVLGEYFQVQDDYLDVFGDFATLGKIGTDIIDRKCSWLVIQALALSDSAQIKELKENYGVNDQSSEQKVKVLFAELHLKDLFHEYEKNTVAKVELMINDIDPVEGLRREVFAGYLKKIYGRSK